MKKNKNTILLTLALLSNIILVKGAYYSKNPNKLIEKIENPKRIEQLLKFSSLLNNYDSKNNIITLNEKEKTITKELVSSNIEIEDKKEIINQTYPIIDENMIKPMEIETYYIKPGDSLYNIVLEKYGNGEYVNEIANYNNISDTNIIKEGDRLLLPHVLPSMIEGNIKTEINQYGFIIRPTTIYNKNLNIISKVETFQKIYICGIEKDTAYVVTENGTYGYISTKCFEYLPKNKFVEVDISDQKTNLYENNEIIFSTSNVTGKDTTPTFEGYYDIDSKSTNETLMGGSFVDYWMPFNGGIGLHDADRWRNNYGGEQYHNNGSHGCVNMPLNAAKTIYNNVNVGTRVLVHK